MARSRVLKPSFFQNEDLAQTSPHARLCFAGLWGITDRAGRLEDRPRRIGAQLFPYEAVDVDALLAELDAGGFIRRYRVNGEGFIQVINFLKHQSPHHREPASTIPRPPDDQTETLAKTSSLGTAPALPEPCPPDPVPVPVPVPVSGTKLTVKITAPPSASRPRTVPPGFDRFWRAYPKRKAKGRAEKAWRKLNPDAQVAAQILDAIARQAATAEWRTDRGRFIPHPDKWLNDRRWEDDDGPSTTARRDRVEHDWFAECKQRHNGRCNGQYAHALQLDIDADRAAQKRRRDGQ